MCFDLCMFDLYSCKFRKVFHIKPAHTCTIASKVHNLFVLVRLKSVYINSLLRSYFHNGRNSREIHLSIGTISYNCVHGS